ncbi:MAG: globin [Thermomicrobiales bacterium]|nr:globin [Thermomicrobiales bacterium]
MTNDSTEHLAQTSDAPTEPGLTRRAALAGAAGLAGASLIGAGDTEAQTDDATAVAEEPSLYERLGGIFAIAAVVDRFSDEIITNPKLNRLAAGGSPQGPPPHR